MRENLGDNYDYTSFAALFAPGVNPVETPWRPAFVTILRFAVGLFDGKLPRQVIPASSGSIP